MSEEILVAKGTQDLSVVPKMSNRHGLIAGATGTGKTVTLQTMAEGFSRIGVPVFVADVKGDLAGISHAGGFLGRLRPAGTSRTRHHQRNGSTPACAHARPE